MTRDEITLELSRLVRSRIDRRCPLWGAEVDVPTGREEVPIGRVDFAGFTPYGYGYGYVPDASSLERGTLTCYEVKSCMDDFRSGHGLNFVGDVNWLVCPFELCDQLRRAQALPHTAGVLCPDASWRRLLVKIENPCKAYSDIRRSMTAAEAVWRIAEASGEVDEANEANVDRDALLALANEMDAEGLNGWAGPVNVGEYARRIREACGEACDE